jgi:predicted TIM-barrel fold metal-dependent hydrolase
VRVSELPWIISVDDHVVEPPNLWWDRLSADDRERGPRVIRNTCRSYYDDNKQYTYDIGGEGPEADLWVYEDVIKPVQQTTACAGYSPDTYTPEPIDYADMRAGCYDAKARIADMDVNHTERSLCFPLVPRFCGQMFLEAKDKDLALECVRAYNDWMIDEWCGDSGGRLIPLGILPLWNPELCAAEIRRNAERGCRAVTFSEIPSFLGLPSLHAKDRWWDPFLRACDETGTVICMHIGSGSKLVTTSGDAPVGVRITLTHAYAEYSLVDWLLSGALARFPNLKIAYSESQAGWAPFILERIDGVYQNSRNWAEIDPIVSELPSSYVPGRVYWCFFDDPVAIENRDRIGVGQLVFETDYPHQDTTWPHSAEVVAKIASMVSPGELERIIRLNAIEMLDLDPTPLVPAGR